MSKHSVLLSKLSLGCLSLGLGSSFMLKAADYYEPPMAAIPAGEFYMGSDRGRSDEQPAHKVSMPAFQMAKYEVTIAEFRKFIQDTGYQMPENCTHRIGKRWFGSGEKDGSWDNNIYALSEYHPVVCVSRQHAIDYAKWLSKKSGKHYRLPTEAEWEYTLRAGSQSRYFFGEEMDLKQACRYANIADLHAKNMSETLYDAPYSDVYTIQDCNDSEVTTSVVGIYQPNAFGVYDMLGNVVERLADCYQDSYVGAPVDGSAVVKQNCDTYVARGGSWHWEAFPSAQRMPIGDNFLAALEGFRIVLDTQGKASAAEPGTAEFVQNLTQAQTTALKSHDKKVTYPSRPFGLTILAASKKQVALHWSKDPATNVSGYNVVRRDPMSNSSKVIATRIKQNHFTDTQPLIHNAFYSVVALNGKSESLKSEEVSSLVAHRVKVPATLQGEAYSSGTRVNVESSSREPKGDKVYLAIGTSQANYQIEVPENKQYLLDARVYLPAEKNGFALWLGDRKLADVQQSNTPGWQTLKDIKINLPKGSYTLSIRGEHELFALNWLNIKGA